MTDQSSSSRDLAQAALADAGNVLPPPAAAAAGGGNPQLAETLTSLQNLIERNADELDRVLAELKNYREEMQGIFANDAALSEASELLKDYSQKLKVRKSQLQQTLEANHLKAKIAELNEQRKEIEVALNNHLLNLYQLTGSKVIDTSTGQREFVIKASLKRSATKDSQD